MNYLTLIIIYLISFMIIMTIFFFGKPFALHEFLVIRILKSIYQNILKILPDFLLKFLARIFNYFFYEKNYLFPAIYCAAVLVCHGILVLDVLSILYYYSLSENHVYLMILALFLNIVSYSTLCLSDPGVITSKNLNSLSSVYKHDQLLYKKQDCDVCQLGKPARARHCKICDNCVYRYDHHCVWSNCCIGGLNIRNFLCFLVSTFVMCANSVYLGGKSLVYFVHYEQLWQSQYVDSDGIARQMDLANLTQHLFMTLPRIVFLVTCLSSVAVGLLGYVCYHIYLAVTNQTSLERHRVRHMMRKAIQHSAGGRRAIGSSATGGSGAYKRQVANWRPFDRGWRENIKEVLQPHLFVKKIK